MIHYEHTLDLGVASTCSVYHVDDSLHEEVPVTDEERLPGLQPYGCNPGNLSSSVTY